MRREEAKRLMDQRDWTSHLDAVTGGQPHVPPVAVRVRTTDGEPVTRLLWSDPN